MIDKQKLFQIDNIRWLKEGRVDTQQAQHMDMFLISPSLLRQRFFLIQEYTTGSRGLFANCKHDSRNSGVYFYSLTLKDGPWKSQIERRTRLPIRGKLFANQTLSFFTFNNGTNNRSRSSFRDGCIFAGKQMNSTCNNEPCGLIMTHHIVKSSY